ncbi:MAG: hypothetical protein ABJH85_19675, partial [Paracoccaceae bacterium]
MGARIGALFVNRSNALTAKTGFGFGFVSQFVLCGQRRLATTIITIIAAAIIAAAVVAAAVVAAAV